MSSHGPRNPALPSALKAPSAGRLRPDHPHPDHWSWVRHFLAAAALAMEPEAIQEELQYRIESDKTHFGGTLPYRNALAWHGYLTGLLEWTVIDKPLFDRVASLLPNVEEKWANVPAPRHPRPSTEVIVRELESRLKEELARGNSRLPEDRVIFWRAYLSGLLEWSVVYDGFRQLIELLPALKEDPVQAILTGRSPSNGDA